jgi:hypothetical protein
MNGSKQIDDVELEQPLILLPSVAVASNTNSTFNREYDARDRLCQRTSDSGSTSNKNAVRVDYPPLSYTTMGRPLHLVANKMLLMSIIMLAVAIASISGYWFRNSSPSSNHSSDGTNTKKNSETECHNINALALARRSSKPPVLTLTLPLKNHCQELYFRQPLDHFGGVAKITHNATTSTLFDEEQDEEVPHTVPPHLQRQRLQRLFNNDILFAASGGALPPAPSFFIWETQAMWRGEPNARNETRGSFARASRCRGYITRVLTRVMTPIHQDASAMTEC